MSILTPNRLLGVAVVVVALPLALSWQGAQTQGQTSGTQPPPLTAAQKAKLQERNRLIPQIRKLQGQGKLADAARLIEKMLALEKVIFGQVHEELAQSLDWLGAVQEQRGDFKVARQAHADALAMYMKLFGEKHWKAVDARWALASVETLAGLTPKERDQVALAKRLDFQGFGLFSRGKYAGAEEVLGRALTIRRKILGEEHPDTATIYNNLSLVLHRQRKYAAAEKMDRRALAIRLKVLSEEHPDTASSYNNLASNLSRQGKFAEAQGLHRQALAIRLKVRGEGYAETAQSYHDLAFDLHHQDLYAAAEEMDRRALAIYVKVLGKEHLYTASSYNNLALDLHRQGKYAAAEEMDRRALAIRLKVLSEEHPDTARSYTNLATDLSQQGKYAAAEELDRKALAIYIKLREEGHPDTALSYNNLATDLSQQGKYAAAEDLHRKALAIRLKVLGEEHRDTASSYNNLAVDLHHQGRYVAAEVLHRKALAIFLKVLNDEHPDTASSYHNLAGALRGQGKYAAAEATDLQALAIRLKVLSEEHPDTASSYNNLAADLHHQGRYVAAEEMARVGAKSFQAARLRVSFTGLGRSDFTAERSRLVFFAALLARNGKPAEAWKYFEDDLGRGLFDDLSARTARLLPEERQTEEALQGQLALLDRRLPDLLAGKRKNPALAAQFRQERDRLLLRLVQFQADMEKKYGPAAGKVYGLAEIQARLAPDAALVGWVDRRASPKATDPNGEHWAVVVRHKGTPVWVKLKGTGPGAAWAERDDKLPQEARRQLRLPDFTFDWEGLLTDLARQRLRPLQVYLEGIKHLIVLPSEAMAGIPVEALTDRYLVSYVPSGTLYAWLQEKRRDFPAEPGDLLALADPDFSGKEAQVASAGKGDPLTRLLRGETWKPLPGTRGEVEAIARLFTSRGVKVTRFLGAQASGANLDRLAAAKGLKRYRYLHLATHGVADPRGGLNSFLALAPKDPSLARYDKLTAGHILRTWKLEADLVTLSACQTGLGEHRGGEGYVGFAQALFLAGAQTLVLSQWEADDTATTLLMHRFYQNLLGQREELKAPLGKAQALAEAKRWLRGLSRDEALKRLKGLGVEVEASRLAGD